MSAVASIKQKLNTLWVRAWFRAGRGVKVTRPIDGTGVYERYGDNHSEFVVNRELSAWLNDRCPGEWTARVNRMGSVDFRFARKGDAIMFKLTW